LEAPGLINWADQFDWHASVDFSKYDMTLSADLLNYAFDVLKAQFTLTEEDESVFEWLRYNYIHS